MLKMIYLLLAGLSLSASASIEEIIGNDARRQVTNLSEAFHATVGQVENGQGYCTGTLVGPRHVLTNGHCVVEDDRRRPMRFIEPQMIRFIPGRTNYNQPFGIYHARRIHTLRSWIMNGNARDDIALIELDRAVPLPIAINWPAPNQNFTRDPIFITGYSKDTPYGTLWEGVGTHGRFFDQRQMLYHTADTLPGTSGALLRTSINGRWVAVGLHVGSQRTLKGHINRAIVFNDRSLSAIRRWMAQ
jgi:glutamyl endopeptidase